MLNSTTKNRINTCRDILVGKIPDPKGQIDQITNALVYKFMDDQDRMSRELDYNAQFFTDDYEKYAWSKLFDTKLTNQDRANLYIEGLDRLSHADHLPDLFKQIFKDAYLPFRDANTIVMFLTEINGFDYAHSEELGNAFEYLLSIMGSQGDAGQFRTPRHIIEFLVDVVDPQKSETILDPACGTAGFLVEAFKHISAKGDIGVQDIAKLAESITGVDIDPGMAKIARVNLYLHGFKTPKITENDTLTNEKLWGTKYDVILANPPFMTPKGGIQPHDKFAIRANRAEVLFTDYIAEHLRLHGRAGIIVPEGIIFQGSNAYKDLRKMLVDDGYLWAVVSLPAGCFNPYSGVKTSILFLDRKRAKQNDSILFVKIKNDGYDLGAQRREGGKNDLPTALEILNKYKDPTSDLPLDKGGWGDLAHLVEKSKIGESGDYNLSGDRYIASTNHISTEYEMVEIQKAINTITPNKKIQKVDFLENGIIPIIDQSQEFISGYTNDLEAKITNSKPLVIFGDHTCSVKYIDFPFAQGADGIKILDTKENLIPKYLYYNLFYRPLKSDGYQRHFSKLKEYQIPLPPLEIQEQIVSELDGYQRIIDGARAVVENYKPTIKIDPEWEMVELGEVCELQGGGTPSRDNSEYWNGNIPWITSKYFSDDGKIIGFEGISQKGLDESSAKIAKKDSTIIITRVSVGKFAYADRDYAINQDLTTLLPSNKILPRFLYCSAPIISKIVKENAVGVGVTGVNRDFVKKIRIPLPPLEIQQSIIERIEEEQRLIDANRRLIEIYEGKIREKMGEVWGVK